MTNSVLCVSQVLISHAETKDGSGGPLDNVDLESGDVLFPRDPVDSERTFTEPTERQSAIVVRKWTYYYCGYLPV